MKKRKGRKDRFVLNVTRKDYEAEIAAGMAPEDAMKPGKRVFRRVDPKRLARPEDLEPQNIKLIVTMRLDSDIVKFFKRRAGEPRAPGYQTQINDALRIFMERGEEAPDFSKLIENETFIKAVAERVRQRA